MKNTKQSRFIIVGGSEAAKNKEAIHLVSSLPNSHVEVVAGSSTAISEWRETPYVTTPDGYVISGIESIRAYVRKVNGDR